MIPQRVMVIFTPHLLWPLLKFIFPQFNYFYPDGSSIYSLFVSFQEMMHGPHYISPHLYYPPEYPPMDPYAHPSLPPSDVYPNRYGSTQLSPRLFDYYRRERSLSERPTDRSEGRRNDSASLKLGQGDSERQSADSSINDARGLDERSSRRHEIADYFSFSKERVAHLPSKGLLY